MRQLRLTNRFGSDKYDTAGTSKKVSRHLFLLLSVGEQFLKKPAFEFKCEAMIPVLKKEIPFKIPRSLHSVLGDIHCCDIRTAALNGDYSRLAVAAAVV
jgi:hypothetical protein